MIASEGYDIFAPILLSGDPAEIVTKVPGRVDLLISTAVFQHFPSKSYGLEVLKAMRELSHQGTIGLIQIRFDNGNSRFASIESLEEYSEKHITFNSYRIDEFWDLLLEAGFQPGAIYDVSSVSNYATFCFTSR